MCLGTDRDHRAGYSQQWNFSVQKTFWQNLNLEVSYLGSKNTNLGIPDPNINELPDQYLSLGTALLASVPNPYFGQIPASSSLGKSTIAAQQLLRPYPRFTQVALFRDNIGSSNYEASGRETRKTASPAD